MKLQPPQRTPEQGTRSRKMRKQSGQSLVEFAFLAPIILLLLVGVIEVGRFAYLSILVASAARAGVQYGAQSLADASDDAGMQAAALSDAQNIPGLTVTMATHFCACSDSPSTQVSCPATCGTGNHALVYVRVQTNGAFSSLFHYPGLPASFPVSGNAVMRVAQ
jgi:Flp pilus assembly protein TadG